MAGGLRPAVVLVSPTRLALQSCYDPATRPAGEQHADRSAGHPDPIVQALYRRADCDWCWWVPGGTSQVFPFHNHDDYKATNNGVYPGGMFTMLVPTPCRWSLIRSELARGCESQAHVRAEALASTPIWQSPTLLIESVRWKWFSNHRNMAQGKHGIDRYRKWQCRKAAVTIALVSRWSRRGDWHRHRRWQVKQMPRRRAEAPEAAESARRPGRHALPDS